MIDLHSHILPGVDDGAGDLAEALGIARHSAEQGIKKIVATPHWLTDGYGLTPEETTERIVELQASIAQAGIELTVLPGAEVLITPELGRLLELGVVSTINHSRYLLLELPFSEIPDYTENVLYDLKVMGYIPVLAHPERYQDIITDPNLLYYWVKEGVLAQLNAGSLLGDFGLRVQQTAEILVQHNLVHLLGSDVHSTGRRKQSLQPAFVRLRELIGGKITRFTDNAQNVIDNLDLQPGSPIYYREKKGFLKRLFS